MIYIEASQINSNGGIVLLELLLQTLKEQNTNVKIYICYEHVLKKLKYLESTNIQFIKTSLFKTFFRYFIRRKNVLYFCNLPPLRHNLSSILYIHNQFFAEKPNWTSKDSSVSLNIRKYIYHKWLKHFMQKVDIVACQTSGMAKQIINTYNVYPLILPFFKKSKEIKNANKKYDFFYPGSVAIHKNNIVLLDAIEIASNRNSFTIALTIEKQNTILQNRIKHINEKAGYEVIHNFGMICHDKVIEIMSLSHALLFPSLKESFGLPLIEALQQNITIISSDLPFTYEVVENPITFNPHDPSDIAAHMIRFLNKEYIDINQRLLVSNKINDLIKILIEN